MEKRMTTHAQHTPGPWNLPGHTLLNDESSDIPIYAKTRTGTRLVAGVSKCYDGAEWANARLIAAAPRMLEAIELLAEWRDVLVQNYPDMPSLVRAAHLARAILKEIEAEHKRNVEDQ